MIPHATYRLQFHKDFPFEAALPLGPYLKHFGISHVYSSPILKARPGSMHGYDIVDHSIINPELGGEEMFRKLAAEMRTQGLGLILDIVPNHMAVDPRNRWWMDVLEHGPGSPFANYFDIDWDILDGKVLTASLSKPYWETLQAGEVAIITDDAPCRSCVSYFERRLPLRPEDQNIHPENFTAPEGLHRLLERQHYRFAWWRTASDIINWRRFFDVPDLIALKQDAEGVFEATHAKIFELYREGLIDGVRVDHVDGLADPAAYCRRLRAELNGLTAKRPQPGGHPYVVVEKILANGESLSEDWGVEGTTGYDFMDEVSALEHDPTGAEPLARLWREISGRRAEFDTEEVAARVEIVHSAFESALTQTTAAFLSLAKHSQVGRDITQAAFRRALIRILERLRIYRTYATGRSDSPAPGPHFEAAIDISLRNAAASDRAAITYIANVLRDHPDELPGTRDAVRRFNQLSAPVAAKGVEDTALYRYGRLLSRNDVGFDPGHFSQSPAGFHFLMEERLKRFPHALLTTATHDHKRGEDVRARLAVFSEIPGEWEQVVRRSLTINAKHRPPGFAPEDEYQLYQTLAGAWPLDLAAHDKAGLSEFCERVVGWQRKALREAKLRSSWLDPNEQYEEHAGAFVRRILDCQTSQDFLANLHAFVQRIAPGGALNGLVQAALRCTVPGVPDCYQGTEFWDFSLVDPDNRRPVDYPARMEALCSDDVPSELLPDWRDGRVKQALLVALLNFRREKPHLFAYGTYQPLQVRGQRTEHVLSFVRQAGNESMVVAVPLQCASACVEQPLPMSGFWEDTRISLPQAVRAGELTNMLTASRRSLDDTVSCGDLFAQFPIAVLATI